MDSLEPIRILIHSNQIHSINKLLSSLRNEGVDLKAQSVRNKKELHEQFKFLNWDLILCCEDSPLSINAIKDTTINHGLELPIIYLSDEKSSTNTAELFKSGIQDCLPIDQESRIVTAIKREVGFQRLKLNHRLLQLDFKELEKRHQTLMDASSSLLLTYKRECTFIVIKVMLRFFLKMIIRIYSTVPYWIYLKEKVENA